MNDFIRPTVSFGSIDLVPVDEFTVRVVRHSPGIGIAAASQLIKNWREAHRYMREHGLSMLK